MFIGHQHSGPMARLWERGVDEGKFGSKCNENFFFIDILNRAVPHWAKGVVVGEGRY